jgi:acyl dehydratase
MSAETWSFTTRGVWIQTTVADFSTGTNNGTTITNTAGGEVKLAALLQDSFSGTGLDTATWTTTSWTSSGGGATTVGVSNGVVSVKGAAVYSVKTYTNTGIEGSVNFGGSTAQHFGLATGLDTVAGRYWAIFSTKSTTNTLYARVNANGATTDVSLGALPTGYHAYKILPTSTGFQFYVDGVLKTTITAAFQTTVALKAAISNFSATTAVLVDSVQFISAGTRTGTFTSAIFDAGKSVTWDQVDFTTNVPAGTTVTVSVRVGTKQADGSILWRTWRVVQNGDKLVDENGDPIRGQYLQYSVTMTSNDATASPEFDDISFTYA